MMESWPAELVKRVGREPTRFRYFTGAPYHQRPDRDLSCFDAYGREHQPNTITAGVMPFQTEKNRFLAFFLFKL